MRGSKRERETEIVPVIPCRRETGALLPLGVLVPVRVGLDGAVFDQELHLLIEGCRDGWRRLAQQDVQRFRGRDAHEGVAALGSRAALTVRTVRQAVCPRRRRASRKSSDEREIIRSDGEKADLRQRDHDIKKEEGDSQEEKGKRGK